MAESLWLSAASPIFTLRLRLGLSMQKLFIAMAYMVDGHARNLARRAPCYYLTSVAKDRLPVFGSDKRERSLPCQYCIGELLSCATEAWVNSLYEIARHGLAGSCLWRLLRRAGNDAAR